MNKKLLTLAVAGIMAAPMAAQAEATIYGKMHVSVENIDNDNSAAAEDSDLAVSSNSSRIGFKGAEDLGGGLKAIWQSESAIDLAGSGSSLSARNSFLGLAGGFGTVLAGRHDTPYKSVGRKVDLFGDTVGDSRSIVNDAGQDARTNNTIAYITPDLSGFSVVAAYVTDVNDSDLVGNVSDDFSTDNSNNSATSISLNYANGPIYVGLANQQISEDAFGAGAESSSATRLAASYSMGAMKFTGLWETNSDIGGTEGNDWDAYGIGAAFKAGANTLKAQYYVRDETDDVLVEDGASKLAVGVDHAMSKQTSAYVMYAVTDNDDGASINVTGSGHGDSGVADGTEAGGSPSALSVGVVHKF